jgi:hypothetical protein
LNGSGDATTFNYSMHPGYNRPASLALLAGTYTRTTSIGYTMTWSFTQNGQLTGSDSRGCVFNGTVIAPDPTHNLYQIDATVTSCGILDGSYQGRGTLLDATAMQNWMGSMGCFQYGYGGWGGMMGGGMMGGGMMNAGCASCHGSDGHGLTTQQFTSPNITYANLTDPKGMLAPDGTRGPTYNDVTLRRAVTTGIDPEGSHLAWPMPQWQLTTQEWTGLLAYLKTLN